MTKKEHTLYLENEPGARHEPDSTIMRILHKVRDEVGDVLEREPEYHGKITLTLNFNAGRCLKMTSEPKKTILVEKAKK